MPKDLQKNLDKQIIESLISDSEIPVESLASKYGVSAGTIRNRIAQLSDSNVIIGYKARARLSKLGMSEVIVGLDIEPENYVAAMGELKKLDFVKELYRASGDHSAIAIIASSSDEADSKLMEMLKIPGVRKAYPSFIQETLK